MGSQTVYETVSACSESDLRVRFSEIQEEKRFEKGNESYAGHMGMAPGLTITAERFKSAKEATNWLEQNISKRGVAKAVKVGDFSKLYRKTAADKKIETDLKAVTDLLNSWDSDLLKRVKAAKSTTKGCQKCESKVAVKYLTHSSCPVCGNKKFLATATDDKKLESLKSKQTELAKKKRELVAKEAKVNMSLKAYWIIAAEVAV